MNRTGIVIILLCFLAAAAVVLWERRKTRKTMEEIERMLDAAMTGSFSETKGQLSADGNRAMSANAEAGLTVRPTSRAVTKVGVSDQVVVSGNAIA